jgi:hypothetical protein
LEKFKKRHNIKNQVRHGEAGSVPAMAEEEIGALRTIAREYEESAIYSIDKTGLFWKLMPS